MSQGKPESQPANQNQEDNTMANVLDDPGMTVAGAEVAVEKAEVACKNTHLSGGFRVMSC
jgi:hypothetical protein